jgi:putative acetyltransferase
MTTPAEFDIRYSELDDLESLKGFFRSEDDFDDFPFTGEESEEAFKNWIGFAKFKASLTGMMGGTPCAVGTLFLMPYRKIAHHAFFFLMVHPDFRRQGIGSSMVRNLIHLAKTRFLLEKLQIEIYEESALISVLEKLGFERFVRQDNFIHVRGEKRARFLYSYKLQPIEGI